MHLENIGGMKSTLMVGKALIHSLYVWKLTIKYLGNHNGFNKLKYKKGKNNKKSEVCYKVLIKYNVHWVWTRNNKIETTGDEVLPLQVTRLSSIVCIICGSLKITINYSRVKNLRGLQTFLQNKYIKIVECFKQNLLQIYHHLIWKIYLK